MTHNKHPHHHQYRPSDTHISVPPPSNRRSIEISHYTPQNPSLSLQHPTSQNQLTPHPRITQPSNPPPIQPNGARPSRSRARSRSKSQPKPSSQQWEILQLRGRPRNNNLQSAELHPPSRREGYGAQDG